MKLVCISESPDSPTKIINVNDLKDHDGNDLELPPDPENNLVFDPRPSYYDRYGWTFDIEIQDSSSLVVTRTGNNYWRKDIYFRAYDRTKEGIPAAFDSSAPYEYWGLNHGRAPYETVFVKVHHTARTIKECAFSGCKKMTTCDISDAPVAEIEELAFGGCKSLRSILFSQVLKKIGYEAFAYCEALDVLVIPSTVTHIEQHAFRWCTNMRILKLPDDINLDNVADDIIRACPALLDKMPPKQTPKKWLKHRYDPYPLHKLCYNAHVTVEEIQQCIQAHPHAAYLSDEFDMTALHMITIMACTSNLHAQSHNQHQHQHQHQDEGATRLLGGAGHITTCFDGNMSAAFVRDDRGKTPLDYLLESCDGLDVHTGLVTSLCSHKCASSVVLHGASSIRQQDSFKRRRYH